MHAGERRGRVCLCALASGEAALGVQLGVQLSAQSAQRRLELHNRGPLAARWSVTPRRLRALPGANRYPRELFCAPEHGQWLCLVAIVARTVSFRLHFL